MFSRQGIGKNMTKRLTQEPNIDESCLVIDSELGIYCELGPNSVMQNTIFLDYSYAGSNCIFQNAQVGKFSNIAASVRVGATDHPMDRPTLHHFTYRSKMFGFAEEDDEAFFIKRASRITTIGHDTWLGHGALIKPGVKIGNGAVIGQGSVVTKDVPAYAIAVGNPAKVIRYRFSPEIIEDLQAIAWWDWSYEKIKENFYDFRGDIESFVKKHDVKEQFYGSGR